MAKFATAEAYKRPATSDAARLFAISLPAPVATEYAAQAERRNVGVEVVMTDRLTQCAAISPGGLYLDATRVTALQKRLGANVSTGDALANKLDAALSLSIAGLEISLTPHLLSRLKDRAFGQPLQPFLAKLITEELERYVGLR